MTKGHSSEHRAGRYVDCGFRPVYDRTMEQIDRGTAHDDEPEDVRLVWSTKQAPKSRDEDTGFRLVRDVVDT